MSKLTQIGANAPPPNPSIPNIRADKPEPIKIVPRISIRAASLCGILYGILNNYATASVNDKIPE